MKEYINLIWTEASPTCPSKTIYTYTHKTEDAVSPTPTQILNIINF